MSIKTQLPIENSGLLYAQGCVPEPVSTSEISISAGQLRDSTNTFDIFVNDPLTVSTAFVGAGGLDSGTVQVNTFYAIHVLYDSSKVLPASSIMSATAAPIMPSVNGVTYSHYRTVGYVKTLPSTTNICDFRIIGDGNNRTHTWDALKVCLSGGTATTPTPVSLSAAVPSILAQSTAAPNSIGVYLYTSFTPAAAGDILTLSNFDENLGSPSIELTGVVAAIRSNSQIFIAADITTVPDYKIKYSLEAGSVDICVTAFTYKI